MQTYDQWLQREPELRECKFEEYELIENHEDEWDEYMQEHCNKYYLTISDLAHAVRTTTGYADLIDSAMAGFGDWLHENEKCQCQDEETDWRKE